MTPPTLRSIPVGTSKMELPSSSMADGTRPSSSPKISTTPRRRVQKPLHLAVSVVLMSNVSTYRDVDPDSACLHSRVHNAGIETHAITTAFEPPLPTSERRTPELTSAMGRLLLRESPGSAYGKAIRARQCPAPTTGRTPRTALPTRVGRDEVVSMIWPKNQQLVRRLEQVEGCTPSDAPTFVDVWKVSASIDVDATEVAALWAAFRDVR